MKLVMASVHFEYTDVIEQIIDRHPVPHYLVHPRIEGRDSEGFHEGSQVHPGNLAALHLRMADEDVDALLDGPASVPGGEEGAPSSRGDGPGRAGLDGAGELSASEQIPCNQLCSCVRSSLGASVRL
ncbi:MAG: hypothetical protein U5R48_14455 [Gammaproteobacteria bacterium]|nr:hypothetical protein [Gammaproteobacteria bacterium]